MAMQALVIAHAAYGHNSFFKGNYLFRMWTDASSIIDYLVYAKNYIAECEERHGLDAVEELLDSCHALQNYGVDRYRRPSKLSLAQEQARAQGARGLRAVAGQRPVAHAAQARRARPSEAAEAQALPDRAAGEPAVLHREERAAARALAARGRAHRAQDRAVLLSAAPDAGDERGLGHVLAPPPAQHDVRRRLPDRRRDDRVAEVAHQRRLPAAGRPPRLQRHQPVRAGLRDVHRHQAHLREPDRRGPRLVPRPRRHAWLPTLDHAMRNFKDESFIGQYLSPEADARLPPVRDRRRREARSELEVSAIHDDAGYRHVREALSRQYDLGYARAQHPGLERQPARRPLADAAPHAAQRPAAARRAPRRCSSTWRGCGASTCTSRASTSDAAT